MSLGGKRGGAIKTFYDSVESTQIGKEEAVGCLFWV